MAAYFWGRVFRMASGLYNNGVFIINAIPVVGGITENTKVNWFSILLGMYCRKWH